MSSAEQPEYKLISSNVSIELREYFSMIVAEVEVSGERKQAIQEGFKILADYIFGNNTSSIQMEMTTPVINEISEKIPMTSPVLQEKHMDKWLIRFIMPKKYDLETLPKPNSIDVNLIPLPARRFAVIQFSGLADNESIKKNTETLEAYILAEQLKPIREPLLAFYNPPWTPHFLRRNEVMIEVKIEQ